MYRLIKEILLVLLLINSQAHAQNYSAEEQKRNREQMISDVPANITCTCSAYMQAQLTKLESIKGTKNYDDFARTNNWLMNFCSASISKQFPGQEKAFSSKMFETYSSSIKLSSDELIKRIDSCSKKIESYRKN